MINDQCPIAGWFKFGVDIMTELNEGCAEKADRSEGCVKYDLPERTTRFGEEIIRFLRTVKLDAITKPLVQQLVRSATGIGANYSEANEAGSRKEFRYRISICGREARESQYWLRMMAAASPSNRETARMLWKEAKELTLIFATIHKKTPETKQE